MNRSAAITAAFLAMSLALPLASCGGSSPAGSGDSAARVALSAPEPMHFTVKGMHCDGCEGAICGKVEKIEGVASVKASHAAESVDVVAPPEQREAIRAAITRLGYKIDG
ncbi:MAG: heavy-metal-associated domain-containing protein [Planctomycetota bacterium]